jgi:hypothetical protein
MRHLITMRSAISDLANALTTGKRVGTGVDRTTGRVCRCCGVWRWRLPNLARGVTTRNFGKHPYAQRGNFPLEVASDGRADGE